jgi:type VII secretion effector (TIGR04197 family)
MILVDEHAVEKIGIDVKNAVDNLRGLENVETDNRTQLTANTNFHNSIETRIEIRKLFSQKFEKDGENIKSIHISLKQVDEIMALMLKK